MKTAFLSVVALALPAVVRSEDAGKGTIAQVLSAQIKQAFPYVPTPPQKAEEKPEPNGEIVSMERLTITESLQLRDLKEKIAAEDAKQKAERFSVVKGGAIKKKGLGKARVEIGAWDAGSGLNILKISW
jgi:hypothetical protein